MNNNFADRWQEIKEWIKDNPKTAFVVGLVFIVLIVSLVGPGVSSKQKFKETNQQPEKTVQKTPATPTTKKQAEPVEAPKFGKIQPIVNGDLILETVNPDNTAMSGNTYASAIEIYGNKDWYKRVYSPSQSDKEKYSQKSALMLFPLSGKYSSVEFLLEQKIPVNNLDNFAPTQVDIILDGESKKGFKIAPETLLTQPHKVSLDTTGKQMLTIKISCTSVIDGSYLYIKNPYPLWICGVKATELKE